MNEEYYNGIASGYNALYGEEQQIKLQTIKRILSGIDISKKTLLDVGCGTGISSDYFVDEYNCTVSGIDPAEELLAQNTSAKSNLIQGVAEELPFESDSFNIVVSVSAIQNFSDLQKGLDEIKRVGEELFILTFMSKGNLNTPLIEEAIESTFVIKDKVIAKNDTLYLATKS